MNIEDHAFGSYIPLNAETLIIGTFPTHKRNREFEFFYPNKSNVFWRVIGELFEYRFQHKEGNEAVEERKRIMSEKKIALTDMLAKAIRTKDGSGDDQLDRVELMDILSIIRTCPTINKIILTSRSGKLNSLNLFQEYLKGNKIPFLKTKSGSMVKGSFEYEHREFSVFVPYSPSPRVERQFGFNTIRDMYQQCFKSINT